MLTQSNHNLEGYWEQPDATAAAQQGNWFHTGDGGYLDDDGYLVISDRKKDVIISGGENVSSIEVEDALMSHDAVKEVAVIGIPDEKWGELVTGAGRHRRQPRSPPADLIAHCRTNLAGYKCPKRVEFVDELPRTATGKLQKFKLREPFWAGQDASGQLSGARPFRRLGHGRPAAQPVRQPAVEQQRGAQHDRGREAHRADRVRRVVEHPAGQRDRRQAAPRPAGPRDAGPGAPPERQLAATRNSTSAVQVTPVWCPLG